MTLAATEEFRIFLSTLPPERAQRRLALSVIAISVAVFLLAAPFAKVPLTPVAAFLPIYQSALILNDLITSVLLFGQFGFLKSRALLVLACGYLFSAAMAVSHALTFPGLFAPTGLFSAGGQSTAWLYFSWHAGFPLFIIGYAALTCERPRLNHARVSTGRSILFAIAATLAIAIGITLIATAGHEMLPTIMQGSRDAPAKVVVATATWMLSVAALVILWRRRPHSVLDLWLIVVLCAWLFDSALASVLNGGRYDVGWYGGRIYGLLASSFVLMVLLIENSVLYVQLFQAHEELSSANNALEMSQGTLKHQSDELEEANAKLAAASRAKDRFLATMSHELRTPLNAIIGFTGTLRLKLPGPLTEAQDKQVGIIQASARHLLSLINDLLDLARIDSGKVELNPETIRAQDLIDEVIQILGPMADSKGVKLERNAPGTEVRITADRRALMQIIINLTTNGIKYTKAGTVSIALAQRFDRDRVFTEIAISDTGCGIKEEEQTKLFRAFERVGDPRSRNESTGLGLYLSRRLAELMGGTISFRSKFGAGSTFTFTLTCDHAAEPTPVAIIRAGA